MHIERFVYRQLAMEWARISAQEASKGRFQAARFGEQIVKMYDTMSVACADQEMNAQWQRKINDWLVAFRDAGGGA